MQIDIASGTHEWRDVYRLLLGFVNPRPIALVASLSPDGVQNLAPFSWYNLVSANPPVVMFSVGVRRDSGQKDTLANIRATGEFVVATVTEAIAPQMVRTAATLPSDESEFDFSGLTPQPATKVKPPLVRESVANLECTVRDVMTISEQPGGASVVFGDVVAVHLADWVLGEDGLIDAEKMRTIGRLGKDQYVTVRDAYSLSIPAATPTS